MSGGYYWEEGLGKIAYCESMAVSIMHFHGIDLNRDY